MRQKREADMTTKEIASRLVELCRQGKNAEALDTLYAEDAISVEAGAPNGGERAATGRAAIRDKADWWFNNHEIHSSEVAGPWPHDDRFIVRYKFDVTNKPSGQRFQMEEAGLYTVKNDKIVREEFFYELGS
jgi:hypothetical protein